MVRPRPKQAHRESKTPWRRPGRGRAPSQDSPAKSGTFGAKPASQA